MLPNLQAPHLAMGEDEKRRRRAERFGAIAADGAAVNGPGDGAEVVDGLDVTFCTNVKAAKASIPSRGVGDVGGAGAGNGGEATIAQLVGEYFSWLTWLINNATKYTVSIKVLVTMIGHYAAVAASTTTTATTPPQPPPSLSWPLPFPSSLTNYCLLLRVGGCSRSASFGTTASSGDCPSKIRSKLRILSNRMIWVR